MTPSLSLSTCAVPAPTRRPEGSVLVVRRGDGQSVVVDRCDHPCAAHILDDLERNGGTFARQADVGSPPGLLPTALHLIPGEDPPRTSMRARTGGSTRTTDAFGPSGHDLAPRERAVLGLVCQGMTNREIAAHLGVTLNTVKTWIRTGYRRIDVTRRSQAVIWGLHHGLGPTDNPIGR